MDGVNSYPILQQSTYPMVGSLFIQITLGHNQIEQIHNFFIYPYSNNIEKITLHI